MQKTIDEAIAETSDNLAKVITESGLPLSILKLILSNTLYQLQQIRPVVAEEVKENAKSEP